MVFHSERLFFHIVGYNTFFFSGQSLLGKIRYKIFHVNKNFTVINTMFNRFFHFPAIWGGKEQKKKEVSLRSGQKGRHRQDVPAFNQAVPKRGISPETAAESDTASAPLYYD